MQSNENKLTWMMLDWDKKDYLTAVYNDREKELFQEEATTLGINVETLARECQRHNQYFERQFGYKPSLSRLPDTAPNIDTPSLRTINKVIKQGETQLNNFVKEMKSRKELVRIFIETDTHYPKEHRQSCELNNMIRADFKAHIEPRLNDAWDFESYGKWNDHNPDPSCRLWIDDIQFAFNYFINREQEKLSAHKPLFRPAINGNHDEWLVKFLLTNAKGFGIKAVADYYVMINDLGISVLAWNKQNTLKLSPGFKITHGIRGSGNIASLGTKLLEDLSGRSYEEDNGVFYNAAMGHWHRSGRIDKYGVSAWMSPGNQDATKTNYGDRHNWQYGCLLGYYDPNQRSVELQIVTYKKEGNNFVGYWNDKRYIAK